MSLARNAVVLLSLPVAAAIGAPAAGARSTKAHANTRRHASGHAGKRGVRSRRPSHARAAGHKPKASGTTTVSTVYVLAPVTLLEPTGTWLPVPTSTTTTSTTTTSATQTVAPAPAPTLAAAAPAPTLAAPVPAPTLTKAASQLAPAPAAATTTTTTPAPATVATGLFAPTSFWNAPLAVDAPLDAKSATYVANLATQRTKYTSWINTTANSAPIYRVGADQPLVKVTLDKAGTDAHTADLRAAFAAGVPIPPTAAAGGGVDHNLSIYQASTDTYWELWVAAQQADGWHARWGGKLTGVSTNEGRYTDPHPRWGSSASSLPLIGGMMTINEVFKGSIDHALAMSLPETRANVYSWPAQRTDGTVDDVNAIPEGTRFRIDPTVNLDAIAMAPLTRMMAVAAQKYGIVVRDKSGSVAFYGEDPVALGNNLWNTAFGGASPSTLMAGFPWSKLQALQTQLAVDPY